MRGLADSLGTAMFNYRHDRAWPETVDEYRADILSMFIRTKKAGLWTPGNEIFRIPAGQAILPNFLKAVGTMLSDGHFSEAKKLALNAKQTIAIEVAKLPTH